MKKVREYESNILAKMMLEIPLKTRIKVALEAHFIHLRGGSFFMPASEEGPEYDEIVRINEPAFEEAHAIFNKVMPRVKQWKRGQCLIDCIFNDMVEENLPIQITVLSEIVEWQSDKGKLKTLKNKGDDEEKE